MKPIFNNDKAVIRCVGPLGLQNLLKGVLGLYDQGYILDPEEKEVARVLSPFEVEAVLIKADSQLAKELNNKTPEELVEIIYQDLAKERLVAIAKHLNINIPDNIKVPKAIAKHLKDAVTKTKE